MWHYDLIVFARGVAPLSLILV